MKYKHSIERLLAWLSKETKLPVDKLHLLNINPKMLENAIDAYSKKGITPQKAEHLIQKQWKASAPKADSPPSVKEMEMMGFVRTDKGWKHKITDTEYSDEQIATLSFQEIEQSVTSNPLYGLYQMMKKKIENEPPPGNETTREG